MKIIAYFVFSNLLLFSCDPDIEYNTRILVKGKVVNSEQEPISNIDVSLFAYGNILGEDISDKNGNFSFVSFKSNIGYEIALNPSSSKFSSVSIVPVNNDNPYDDLYRLGEIELKPVSLLNFEINKTSTEEHQLTWRLRYSSSHCTYEYDFVSLVPGTQECHETNTFSYKQNINQPNFSKQFKTLQNTNVKFIYQLDNQPEVSLEILMKNQTFDYEFTY